MNCIQKGMVINLLKNIDQTNFNEQKSDLHSSYVLRNIRNWTNLFFQIIEHGAYYLKQDERSIENLRESQELLNKAVSQRVILEKNPLEQIQIILKSQHLSGFRNNQQHILNENAEAPIPSNQIECHDLSTLFAMTKHQLCKYDIGKSNDETKKNKSQIKISLRGGGCVNSQLEREITIEQEETRNVDKLPSYFMGDLVKYLNIIISKASLASDEKQKEEIILAIQWFTVMREHFNTLCIDSKLASSVYDLIFKSFPQLLQSAVTYIRISGFLCIQVLQIINDLCRVLFTFFMTNGKRFLKIEDKEYFDELVSDIETQIDIESANIWVAGAEFEITMIQAVIQSSPSNSDEGQKLMVSFLGGLVQSVLTMSPTDELIDTLIGGAKFLYQAHQVQDLKKKYEVYYYFESLKWYMIQLLRQDVSTKRVIQILRNGFIKYIENTNDWLLNFCWVKMITSLISYRPIISKQDISLDKVEQSQIWNQLIKQKFISQLSFNTSLGRLQLYQNVSNQETQALNKLMQKLGINSFQMFSDLLLKSLEYSQVNLFQFREKGQQEQIKIDYLYDILFGNNQLEESIEQSSQLQIGQEQLLIKIKQGYEKYKKLEKHEKEKRLQIEEIVENVQEINKQAFCTFSLSTNLYKIFILYFERFQLILNSIIAENDEQQQMSQLKNKLLEQISDIEQNFQQKCSEALQQLQEQKKQLITSLATLEVYFENKNQQEYDELIIQQFQNISSFIDSVKNMNSQFVVVNEKIKQIVTKNQTYQKNQIQKFKQDGNLKMLEQIAQKMMNKNYFKPQVIIINELFQTSMKMQGDFSIKLINYNSLRYFLIDLANQLNEMKEQTEFILKFIRKNMASLQVLESSSSSIQLSDIKINNSDVVNDMLRHQYKYIQQFFIQEESQSSSGKANDQITGQQILQLLKNDAGELQDMQSKHNDDQSLKPVRYAVAIVEQFMNRYLKYPQKLHTIQEQIFQIYQQLNLKQDQGNQKQPVVPQQEKQKKNQPISKIIENIQIQLMNVIDIIQTTIPKCQIILEGVVDKITLYQNIQQIQMQLDYQTSNEGIFSLEYETNDNMNLMEHITYLREIQIELNDLNTDFNQSIIQGPQYAGLLQIVLLFCDLIRPNLSISINLEKNLVSAAQSFIQDMVENEIEGFEEQNYKARQCYVISLISAQSSSQEQNIIKFCQDSIVQIWAEEKDERVKSLLKNQELMEMQKTLFSSDLKSFSKRLQLDMEERLNKISDLEQKIYLEGDSSVRQQMQEQMQIEQLEFEDYLDNINDMAGKLDIGIQFLKDIKRSLTQLKQKIDKLQDAVNNIGDDIRKLRGKNFNELLNIRKRKVLEQMQVSSLNQIYIPLKCQEWDPISGKQVGNPSILLHDNFKNQEGEVNEFLQKDQSDKDVFLLRGVAGSGKSRAAGKIEEFLWQKIDSKESTWIPIYVSLPTLKEPKFNLIDQALESDFYQFDKIQVKEFKEALEQENYKILLILDSYDEMKQDCIQSNLYQTNRFQKDLFGNLQDSLQIKQQLKVIITTRTEALTSSSYQTWFYGDTLQSLKEVELLGFDDEQQHKYLEEFTFLCMKKEFLELYSFAKQMQKQKIDVEEFCVFWKKISDYSLKNQNTSGINENQLINDQQTRQIISIFKLEKIFQKITKDQIVNLQKKIMDLWSPQKFERLIVSAQIQNILTTPFMMEIVVQVLPSMTKKYSDASSFKDKFINNYIQFKLESQIEKQQIQSIQNKRLLLLGLEISKNKEEKMTETDFKQKALKIWDQLQNKKYLQKFSLVDKMKKTDLLAIDDAVIVIRALIVKKLTVFDFYYTFVEFYHQQQIKKQQELGRMINQESLILDLFNFSQSLAIQLTINELSQVKYISKGQLTLKFVETHNNQEEDWLDAYFNDFKDNGEYKKLIRSCLLLTSKGRNNSFTHKSIQEFYVGHFLLKMLDELKILEDSDFQTQLQTFNWENTTAKLKEKNQQQVGLTKIEQFSLLIYNSLYNKNKFNIATDNYKGVMSIIKEEIKQKSHFKPKLLQIVKLSSISKEFTRAASNSLYLLGYNNDFLGFQQFQNISISDIDLVGVSFYGSNLKDTEFQNVSIRSCNFSKVNFTNAKWTDIKCDELQGLIGHTGEIEQVCFSHNGQILVSISVSDYTLRFWNIQEGKQLQKYTFNELKKLNAFGNEADYFKINSAVFSTDDQVLGLGWHMLEGWESVCVENYATQLLDLKTGKSLGFQLQPDEKAVEMIFSNDSKTFASCYRMGIISLYNLLKNQVENIVGHQGQTNSILFTEDDQILISCGQDKLIKLWNYKEKKMIVQLEGHEQSVLSIALQPQGVTLASCSDKTIKLWNILTYELLFNLDGHKEKIFKLKFLSDGQHFVSWGQDTMILIWNAKEGKQIRFLERTTKYPSEPICFSSDDKVLAQKCQNEIQLWDISVGKIISVIGGQQKSVKSMAFQPENQILTSISSGENVIHLWNAKTQKNTSQLDGHKKEVIFVGFSPDNKIVYSASKDETIRLWNVQDGKPLQSLNNIKECRRIEFSKKGEFIFIIGDLNYIWYFKEGGIVTFKDEEFKKISSIYDMAIQPQGVILSWGYTETSQNNGSEKKSTENKIKLYNIKEKKEVAVLDIKSSYIKKLKFSSDGLLLASISYDYKLQLWDMKTYLSIVTLDDVDNIIFSPNNQIFCALNYSQPYGIRIYNKDGIQIGMIENERNILFSPNSQILASITQKNLYLWNANDGKQIAALTGHQQDIEKIKFSSDGSLIASYAYESLIYLWDVKNCKFLRSFGGGEKSKIRGITFSGNGQFLVSYSQEYIITIWNYKEGTQIAVLNEHKTYLELILFSPNDQFLVSCDQNYQIVIWDVNTWTKIKSIKSYFHSTANIKDSVIFSPDSQNLALLSSRAINIWNFKEGKMQKSMLGHQCDVDQASFSADSSILVSKDTENNCLILWDTEKFELINVIAGDNTNQKQLLLSNDDKKVASYLGDRQIRLYDTESGQQIAAFNGHKHFIWDFAFSPDSSYLASCSLDYTIILWDMNKLQQYTTFVGHEDFVRIIAFSPFGRYLVSSSADMTMRVWDIESLQQISCIQNDKARDSIKNVQFSPDGKQLALCNSQQLYVWNLKQETPPIQLETNNQRIDKIYGFVPNGKLLITFGSYDIQIWDIEQYKLINSIKANYINQKCELTQDGKFLFILGQNYRVNIWDLAKNKQIGFFQEHTNSIEQIALSTDDLVMASCSDDNTVKLSYISENFIEQNQPENILSSYKTLAIYTPITAQDCEIQGALIQSKIGWNLKQLFLQRGAKEDQVI